MRIYTLLTDAQIERVIRSEPVSRERIQTIYSDDGIYEIKTKIHKVITHDLPSEIIVINGHEFRTDPSIRNLQERWQIPVPHNAISSIRSTYAFEPSITLIVEQNRSTTYYFNADSCTLVANILTANF